MHVTEFRALTGNDGDDSELLYEGKSSFTEPSRGNEKEAFHKRGLCIYNTVCRALYVMSNPVLEMLIQKPKRGGDILT